MMFLAAKESYIWTKTSPLNGVSVESYMKPTLKALMNSRQCQRHWFRTTCLLKFPSLESFPPAWGGLLSYLTVAEQRDLTKAPENEELIHNS